MDIKNLLYCDTCGALLRLEHDGMIYAVGCSCGYKPTREELNQEISKLKSIISDSMKLLIDGNYDKAYNNLKEYKSFEKDRPMNKEEYRKFVLEFYAGVEDYIADGIDPYSAAYDTVEDNLPYNEEFQRAEKYLRSIGVTDVVGRMASDFASGRS